MIGRLTTVTVAAARVLIRVARWTADADDDQHRYHKVGAALAALDSAHAARPRPADAHLLHW